PPCHPDSAFRAELKGYPLRRICNDPVLRGKPMAEKAPPILLSCVSSRTGVLRGPPRNELVLILDVGRLLLEEMEQLMPFHIYLTTQCPVLSTSPTFTSSLRRT